MNVDLIIRMYEMGYSIEAISLRLRHSEEMIELAIQKHKKWKEEIEAHS
jgi:hypothetical protein